MEQGSLLSEKLNLPELELARKLKSFCNEKGKEKDVFLTAPILQELGEIYGKKKDKLSLIRAAGLLNAALVRQPKNVSAEADLKKLYSRVLQMAKAAQSTSACISGVVYEVAQKIENMRQKTKQSLKVLEKIPYTTKPDILTEMETTRIKDIRSLQNIVSEMFVDVMDYICKKCVEILGKKPCNFVLIGMGSLARGEVTPYSDFESVIVLKEGVQLEESYGETLEYFRWHSVLFQIILVSLKETILRFLSIPGLNDSSKPAEDWFFDDYTPCGICPDGFAAHACKNPLGRQEPTKNKPWITELIKPVHDMVTYLDEDTEAKKEYFLGDLLTKTCFVSGDRGVYGDFTEQVRMKLKTNLTQKCFNYDFVIQQIRKNLKTFDTSTKLDQLFFGKNCDIKRVVYRSTTIFISALGRIFSVEDCSSFDIVDRLEEKRIIGLEMAHSLKYALAIACQVRLTVYMSEGGQDDMVGQDDYYDYNDNRVTDKVLEIVGERSTVDYFTIALSLQDSMKVEQNLENFNLNIVMKPSTKFIILHLLKMYDPLIKEWKAYTSAAVGDENDLQIRFYVALTQHMLGNYAEALEMFQRLNQAHIVNPTIKKDVLVETGRLYMELKRYDDAINYMESTRPKIESLQISEGRKLNLLSMNGHFMGQCNVELKRFEKALSCFQQALKDLHQSDVAGQESGEIRWLLALVEISRCSRKLGSLEEALARSLEALAIGKRNKFPAALMGECYKAIGKCYFVKDCYDNAFEYFSEDLKVRMALAPAEKQETDKGILSAKKLIAACQVKLQDPGSIQ